MEFVGHFFQTFGVAGLAALWVAKLSLGIVALRVLRATRAKSTGE